MYNTFHCFHKVQTTALFFSFFSQHVINCTVDNQYSGDIFNEWVLHELTNAGFNILTYYLEEDNLSWIIRGLRVDFITTDDVQKPQRTFFANLPGNSSMKPSIFVSSLYSPSHRRTSEQWTAAGEKNENLTPLEMGIKNQNFLTRFK